MFEWLSEDESPVEFGETDSDPQNASQNQTVLDMSLMENETIHEIDENAKKGSSAKPTPPTAPSESSTTSAAANALKGLMNRKRA